MIESHGKIVSAPEESDAAIAAAVERLPALLDAVARLAHDAGTPLGVINEAAHVIAKGLDAMKNEGQAIDPELLDDMVLACTLIRSNVERAGALIAGLRQQAAGVHRATRRSVDLMTLLEELRQTYRLRRDVAKLGVAIACSLDPRERAWTGDPEALWRVLTNLLSNVERYAYPGSDGGPVEISLTRGTSAGTEHFELVVRDFGVGIPDEHIGDIFGKDFTTGAALGGMGLGLAIVDDLVGRVLGGSLRVDSRLSAGTAFHVRLPVSAR